MKFTHSEKKDLIKGWLAVSLAFAIIFTGPSLTFFPALAISLIVVGTGFLLHELAHKKVAIKYGCYAEFKSFDLMLVFAVLMSLFGLLLAAPGGVFIHKNGRLINRRENGHISAAGPITNLIIALLFAPLILLPGFLGQLGNYGYSINAFLAFFNALPFGPLDGVKIFEWDKKAGAAIILASLSLLLLTYLF